MTWSQPEIPSIVEGLLAVTNYLASVIPKSYIVAIYNTFSVYIKFPLF